MIKKFICTVCPRGCPLLVVIKGGKILSVSGNGCKRGQKYAECESTKPMRTLTSTIRVSNRKNTMLSVKTSCPIPKAKIPAVMRLIRSAAVEAPFEQGRTVIRDIFPGVSVISTESIR